jgi:hypothetical protein
MGYQLYSERQKTDRVEIDVGKNGISIEKPDKSRTTPGQSPDWGPGGGPQTKSAPS